MLAKQAACVDFVDPEPVVGVTKMLIPMHDSGQIKNRPYTGRQ